MGDWCGADLPSCLDAVEVGAVEGAGEDPELGEAEAVGLLDGRIPHVDGGLGAVHRLLRRRRVRDRVLHRMMQIHYYHTYTSKETDAIYYCISCVQWIHSTAQFTTSALTSLSLAHSLTYLCTCYRTNLLLHVLLRL
jgi:23S rRNA G2445 N2-methylase RlmL